MAKTSSQKSFKIPDHTLTTDMQNLLLLNHHKMWNAPCASVESAKRLLVCEDLPLFISGSFFILDYFGLSVQASLLSCKFTFLGKICPQACDQTVCRYDVRQDILHTIDLSAMFAAINRCYKEVQRRFKVIYPTLSQSRRLDHSHRENFRDR